MNTYTQAGDKERTLIGLGKDTMVVMTGACCTHAIDNELLWWLILRKKKPPVASVLLKTSQTLSESPQTESTQPQVAFRKLMGISNTDACRSMDSQAYGILNYKGYGIRNYTLTGSMAH